ncbi:uncharacterized protein LOC109414917 [Aedes albopictus]|uniref:Odorant receptor n=1 Tax=Aedes albopictus TaxID=7160 RepID=A0ABM1YQQ7_AEDAL
MIRYIVNSLFAYQLVANVLQLRNTSTINKDHVLRIVVELLKLTGICACCLRVTCMVYSKERIETIKRFITYDTSDSGDSTFDEQQRQNFKKHARAIVQTVFGLIITDTILLTIPCSATRNLIGFPTQLSFVGQRASSVLHFLLVTGFPLATFSKFTCSMANNVVLLLGMRVKLNIVAHRYRQIFKQECLDQEQRFDHMNEELRKALIQQTECWRHLSILKDIVGRTFIPVHYYSLYCIGSLLYVSRDMGVNATSGVLVASVCFLLLEYYVTCRLIDSLRDVTDSIGYTIFELCARIPYTRKSHQKFVHMKRALIITWINTSNVSFANCFQLFNISTSAFVGMLNITYSVFTFLINVGW